MPHSILLEKLFHISFILGNKNNSIFVSDYFEHYLHGLPVGKIERMKPP